MSGQQAGPQGSDPRNYKWGFCYYNKSDPRVIVPKRWKWMGWTLNFAHASAVPVALLLVGVCLGIPLVIAAAAGGSPTATLTGLAIGVAMLCLICAYLSSREDF
jgi:hypothetical protein